MISKKARNHARNGEQFLQRGYYLSAIQEFDKAIDESNNYAWALARRGDAYSHMGAFEKALKDFKTVDILSEKALQSAALLRERAKNENSVNTAQHIQKAKKLEQQADSPWTYAHWGEAYRLKYLKARPNGDLSGPVVSSEVPQTGHADLDEAIKKFEKALYLTGGENSTYAWALAHQGATYRLAANINGNVLSSDAPKNPMLKKADELLSRAIDADGTYAWAYAFRSTVRKLQKKYKEACDDLQKAAEFNFSAIWLPARDQAMHAYYKVGSIEPGDGDDAYADFTKSYDDVLKFSQQGLVQRPGDPACSYLQAVSATMLLRYPSSGNKNRNVTAVGIAESNLRESSAGTLCSLAGLAVLKDDVDEVKRYIKMAKDLSHIYVIERLVNDQVLRDYMDRNNGSHDRNNEGTVDSILDGFLCSA